MQRKEGTVARSKKGTKTVAVAVGEQLDKRNTPYYDVHDPTTGDHICRVAAYSNPIVFDSDGVERLIHYFPVFLKELEKGKWGGFVLDSVSFAALAARKLHQYTLNPDTANQLQWYGGATDLIEEILCCQLPSFPCHVGVAYHVHVRKVEETEGRAKSMRQPYVPGRRLEETKMTAAAWPELYRLYIKTEEEKRRRYIQTECSATYQAGSCMGMPDGTRVPKTLPPDFVYGGWKGKGAKPEVHVGVYGDPHVGKSIFLAQLFRQLAAPKPFYVANFDARGKDMAYRVLGEVQESA